MKRIRKSLIILLTLMLLASNFAFADDYQPRPRLGLAIEPNPIYITMTVD